ncbi:putative reverse transcriptase domain-containing protein, partial [Tanacetum coccineum]
MYLKKKLAQRKAPKTRTTPAITTTTTTLMTDDQLKELIAQGVANVLEKCSATKSRNGEDSHDSRTGVRRTERAARECTYPDFMKCKPLYFKGIEGAVKLTQWFERMETVFCICNCTIENHIKFATCTLLRSALTWWNSYVRTVGHDVAYATTWTNLKEMITDKYCPRGEINKLEVMANDSARMSLKAYKIEKYFAMFARHDSRSVMCNTKQRLIQDAIEFAIELMDKKISTFAERQADNKIKFDDTSRNNQNRGRITQRANVARFIPRHWSGQKATCFECEAHRHFKRECPKLKNNNRANPVGNGNAPAKVSSSDSTSGILDKFVPGAAPVVRAPYRLAPSELKKLNKKKHEEQLKAILELLKKEELYAKFSKFIKGFSKIAKSMTKLTQKGVKLDWADNEEAAFQLIKQKLCSAPILALPEGSEDFVVYCDASHKGLG